MSTTKGNFLSPALGSVVSFSVWTSERRIDVDALVIQIVPDGVIVRRYDNQKLLLVTMEEVDTIPNG